MGAAASSRPPSADDDSSDGDCNNRNETAGSGVAVTAGAGVEHGVSLVVISATPAPRRRPNSPPDAHAARVAAIDKALLTSVKPARFFGGVLRHVSDLRYNSRKRQQHQLHRQEQHAGDKDPTLPGRSDSGGGGSAEAEGRIPRRRCAPNRPESARVSHHFTSGDYVTTVHGDRGQLSAPVEHGPGGVERFLVCWEDGSHGYVRTKDIVHHACAAAEGWTTRQVNGFLREARAARRHTAARALEAAAAAAAAVATAAEGGSARGHGQAQNYSRSSTRWYGSDSRKCAGPDSGKLEEAAALAWQSDAYKHFLALCDAVRQKLCCVRSGGGSDGGGGDGGGDSATDDGNDRREPPPLPLQASVFDMDPLQLYKSARAAKPDFDAVTHQFATATGGELAAAPCKCARRSCEKVVADLNGDWRGLTDIVRATVVYPSLAALLAALRLLSTTDTGMEVVHLCNGIDFRKKCHRPSESGSDSGGNTNNIISDTNGGDTGGGAAAEEEGYRDCALRVLLSGQDDELHVCELRLALRPFWELHTAAAARWRPCDSHSVRASRSSRSSHRSSNTTTVRQQQQRRRRHGEGRDGGGGSDVENTWAFRKSPPRPALGNLPNATTSLLASE